VATNFDIQGPTRRCSVTGRDLVAGEKYVAALTDQAGRYVRADFAAEVWPGPPAGCVAFWPGRVRAAASRKPAFPDALLVDWFRDLAGNPDPSRINLRYVVALLLMRRKRLKFEDLARTPAGDPVLVVRDAKTGTRHDIPDPRLTEAEVGAVQAEIFGVLGWN